jgi:hypothetical protein
MKMVCDILQFHGQVPTFQTNLLLPPSWYKGMKKKALKHKDYIASHPARPSVTNRINARPKHTQNLTFFALTFQHY